MRTRLPFAVMSVSLLAGAAGDQAPWPLAEQEHFLLTARIESSAFAGKGLTGSQKAVLSDGRRTHAAHVQTIDLYVPLFRGKDGSTEQDFKDSWKFNVAAYRLAKLLHLTDMVPVSVERTVDGRPASVTWWIDGVAMDERERVSRGAMPPDLLAWNDQMDTIKVFDQLIYNMDRSQENLLITGNWKVWMIDHTRAFRKWPALRRTWSITHCNPNLLYWLKALRREDVAREMGDLLTAEEREGLMVRRDLIVSALEGHGTAQ
jgi:hypothetical protein